MVTHRECAIVSSRPLDWLANLRGSSLSELENWQSSRDNLHEHAHRTVQNDRQDNRSPKPPRAESSGAPAVKYQPRIA
jgi:hypothetical protein